jgi:mitochondrial import inner membrane translocase subunit TIM23
MRLPLRILDSGSRLSCSTFAPGLRSSQTLVAKRHASSRALQPSSSRPTLSNSNNPSTTPSSFFTPSLCRHASSSVASASDIASNSSPSPSSSLGWNSFFQLRTSRRRYSLTSSILGSIATTATTITTLTTYPSLQDAILRVITLDPMVSLGLTTFAGLGAGWLIGPFFGNFAWRALHRSSLGEFVAKEKGFFERIKKHRVDPRGASANNPVPDYYGEKVGSVRGYRRWLKDQRAFNRKRGGLTT